MEDLKSVRWDLSAPYCRDSRMNLFLDDKIVDNK